MMDATKRAAAVGLGGLAIEALCSAVFSRAGLGPLPLLVLNAALAAFAILVLIGRETDPHSRSVDHETDPHSRSVDRSASIFDEIGLGRSPLIGLPVGLAMAAPLAITLYFTRHATAVVQPLHLLRLALATALADEIFYRGFALRLLIKRAKWNAVAAIVATAAFVMLARVLSTVGSATPGDVAQAAVVGGATQVWFGFVFVAWQEDLWVTLALHFGLNLGWSAFEGAVVTDTGSPWTHVGRLACLVTSIALTLALRRLRRPKAVAS
jgi:hypothetical protein